MKGRLLSVLIVDDAMPIRQELRMMDWNAFGAVLVGEASNGQEALEFCREYTPDVVITDIQMPVMDGLELFRCLKQEFSNTQVIVLTCYSEFNYAKEALSLGAVDYIVKVLMKDEDFEKALQKARQANEREALYKSSSKEKQRIRISRILGDIIYSPNSQLSLDSILESHGFKIIYPARFVYMHVISSPNNLVFIDQEISAYLKENAPGFLWLNMDKGVYGLIFNDFSKSEKVFLDCLEALIQSLNERLDSELHFMNGKVRLYFIVSAILTKEIEFVDVFKKIETWNDLSFYQCDKVIFYDGGNKVQSLNPNLVRDIKKQLRYIEETKGDMAEFIEDKFYKWAMNNTIRPSELKNLVLDMFKGIESRDPDKKVNFLKISQTDSIDELVKALVQELGLNLHQKGPMRSEIREAIKIINENIEQPITLSYIASKVALSPFYLGKIFSDEVGESFNDYVTGIRMKKAVELLQTSNLKVYEVAEKVGIPNYRYFSNLFRNWTGQTPKEFKRG